MKIDVDGTLHSSVSLQAVTSLDVSGLGGKDRIDLRGVSLPANIDGGGGNDGSRTPLTATRAGTA